MVSLNEPNWKQVAQRFLEQEREIAKHCVLSPTGVVVSWRNEQYIGQIQEIAPEYSKEIVDLSKSSRPVESSLVEAIKELDSGRLLLTADNSLDLTDRQHILRRLNNRLTYLTSDQTQYMAGSPIRVVEL